MSTRHAPIIERGEEKKNVPRDLRCVRAAKFGYRLPSTFGQRAQEKHTFWREWSDARHGHLEQGVYQRQFLLRATVTLTFQSRDERLSRFLGQKRDDQPAQPFSDELVLVFNGVIWGNDLVTEYAEGDLGVHFEMLNQRSLHHGNLSRLIWQGWDKEQRK